jgi:hypothetical protein
MPPEKALIRERRCEILRGIKHHLDHAFDVAICWLEGADSHAETARDRRADLFCRAFRLRSAGFQHFFREFEGPLPRALEASPLHVANQPSLSMADGSEAVRQAFLAPSEKQCPLRS